jgi:hypothetical protein
LASTSRRFWYFCADLLDAVLRAFERGDRGDLDRRERAVVVVALDARERRDQVAVADHEADAPAGHVVALAHREELDGDVRAPGTCMIDGAFQPSKTMSA